MDAAHNQRMIDKAKAALGVIAEVRASERLKAFLSTGTDRECFPLYVIIHIETSIVKPAKFIGQTCLVASIN